MVSGEWVDAVLYILVWVRLKLVIQNQIDWDDDMNSIEFRQTFFEIKCQWSIYFICQRVCEI